MLDSYKSLPFSKIRFSNFIRFFCLAPWSWCLKYIYIWLTPFGPLYRGPGDPNIPKMTKAHLMYWNHFKQKCPKILCLFEPQIQNFTEFPDNWENWEFFANFGFWNFKMWYSDSWQNFEWNFGVKHVLAFDDPQWPLGGHTVTKSQNMSRTKISLKILPGIWISHFKISKTKRTY